jgi:hypothetical protein
VLGDDLAGAGKADTRTGDAAGDVSGAAESLEDPGQVGCWNPDPLISDG